MFVACDVLASFFGFVGSVLLILSSWRGIPYKRVVDLAKTIRPGTLLAEEAKTDARAADEQLARIMAPEPLYLRGGAICLMLGFLLSIAKYIFPQ